MNERPERYDEHEQRWWVQVPCEQCGGYRLDLDVRGPEHRAQARSAAGTVLAHRQSGACLACASLKHRRTPRPASADASLMWFDALAREWMLWLPVPGIPDGVTLPLGVRSFAASDEAEVSARLVAGRSPLLLRVIEPGQRFDWQSACLTRDAGRGGWQLWVPCFQCTGCMVPLTAGAGAPVEAGAREALECLSWYEASGCPQCITRFARSEAGQSATLWYDTTIHDWMARAPMADGTATLLFPLNLDRYSASQDEVSGALNELLERLRKDKAPR